MPACEPPCPLFPHLEAPQILEKEGNFEATQPPLFYRRRKHCLEWLRMSAACTSWGVAVGLLPPDVPSDKALPPGMSSVASGWTQERHELGNLKHLMPCPHLTLP